jgi:hypothetical protein
VCNQSQDSRNFMKRVSRNVWVFFTLVVGTIGILPNLVILFLKAFAYDIL